MRVFYLLLILVAGGAVRLALFRARRRRRSAEPLPGGPSRPVLEAGGAATQGSASAGGASRLLWDALERGLGDVGLVASREIRERLRGRIFRVGTVLMVLGVSAAIVIPTLTKSGGLTPQTVGVLGPLSPGARQLVLAAAKANQDKAKFVPESSLASAEAHLRSGETDFVIVDASEILLDKPVSSSNSPADPGLVQDVAQYLGVPATTPVSQALGG